MISCGDSVKNGGFLGTEQSVECLNIIGPEEDRDKRTHCPEAVVGQHRADTVLIYLFKQDLSTFSDETYRRCGQPAWTMPQGANSLQRKAAKISGGNSQEIIERDLV